MEALESRPRTTFARLSLGFFVALALATPARAASNDLPTYVSDEFRRVARQIVRDMISKKIGSACAATDVICQTVVKQTENAFESALSGDQEALKRALGLFFVESSLAAVLHSSIGQHVEGELAGSLKEFMPLVNGCLAGVLKNQSGGASCRIDEESAPKAVAFLKDYGLPLCQGGSAAAACQILDRLKQKQAFPPYLLVGALADMMVGGKLDRPDLRVYLLTLSRLLEYGVTDGVFDAALAYFGEDWTARASQLREADTLVDYDPENPGLWHQWIELSPQVWPELVRKCQLAPGTYATWKQDRDDGQWWAGVRTAYLNGRVPDFSALTALAAYSDVSCPDDASRNLLKVHQNHVTSVITAITVQAAIDENALGALAAAALIDYVRTHDTVKFEKDLYRVFVFGAARLGAGKLIRADLAKEQAGQKRVEAETVQERMEEAMGSCETRVLAALLGVAPLRPDRDDGNCFSVRSGDDEPLKQHSLVFPPAVTSSWLLEHAPALADVLSSFGANADGATAHAAPGSLEDVLRRSAESLRQGDLDAFRRKILHSGLDLLNEQVANYVKTVAGDKASAETCKGDVESQWIWGGIGGECAASLLIQSAYHPISEYLWNTDGTGIGASGSLSQDVYRELATSPFLERTMFILNVGPGVTHIVGDPAIWGGAGFNGLTVVDKYGLALYKVRAEHTHFEMGFFAGGFADALVRTVIGEGKSERYWLLGATAGWTKMWGYEFGLQLHLARALPFQLNSLDRAGWATGAALVMPFSLFFSSGN